jgi:hypothetical protein
VNTRAINPGDVIGEAFRIYREQAAVVLPLAFGLFAINAVFELVVGGPGSALVALVVGLFYQGAVVQLVRDVQDGRRDNSAMELVNSVTPVALSLLAVSLLSAIGVVIGLVLLILPGLYLLTIWAVAAPVIVIERPGVFGAFGRSQELVKGNGWSVFALLLIVAVLVFVPAFIIQLPADAAAGHTASAVIDWVVQSLVAPIGALTSSVLYYALVNGGIRPAPEADAATPDEPTGPAPVPTPPTAPSGTDAFGNPVAPPPDRSGTSVPPPGS